MNPRVKDILKKYEKKLKKEIGDYQEDEGFSREYIQFRREALSKPASIYENICNGVENVIKIKPKEEELDELRDAIRATHLRINPEGAASFAMFIAVLIILFSFFLIGFAYFLAAGNVAGINLGILAVSFMMIIAALVLIKVLTRIPIYMASKYRLKVSNQMVLCVLYIIIYMRHTSNLERAIKFASDHIGQPLSLDLRKVFWDVETRRYSTIKESLDHYLESWRDYSLEFVEAFHLIEGSLYEPTESRRVEILEKGLEVMLTGTYEKMMHYAQELKSPITMLHMLGIILPILGLVILPLLASLTSGSGFTKIIVLVILYNILLPLIVYFYGRNILSKRPTGYGVELTERVEGEKHYFIAIFIFIIIVVIGLIPILIGFIDPSSDFTINNARFFDYRQEGGGFCELGKKCFGPFGFGAVIFSLAIPLSLALSLGSFYTLKTRRLIKRRNETKKLEREFAGGLFQLGNRIGEGIPAENAFFSVAENMSGTPTGNFFAKVSDNISRFGMSIKAAIFDEKNGAIWLYPSDIIQISMKVLIESAKKGSKVVSMSLISISSYLTRLREINERLKDLLSEIVSSMKSQIIILTPAIAGIVVGISTMIITILTKLYTILNEQSTTVGEGMPTMISGLPQLFNIENLIPTYYLQIVIGIYVIEVIFILTVLANGIENGPDKLTEENELGKNLYRSGLLYCAIALIVTLLFSGLAMAIQLGSLT